MGPKSDGEGGGEHLVRIGLTELGLRPKAMPPTPLGAAESKLEVPRRPG